MIRQCPEDDVEMMAQLQRPECSGRMPLSFLQWGPQEAQSDIRKKGPVMALVGQEWGAQESIEYPDGVEFASRWQCAGSSGDNLLLMSTKSCDLLSKDALRSGQCLESVAQASILDNGYSNPQLR